MMVGGGIGSFVTVDYLRIAGVTTGQIRILSDIDLPWRTYEYLTRVSQIPQPERIRSDSASRPDNIWGFPSYALAEAFRDRTLKPLRQVLVEPIETIYYTPQPARYSPGWSVRQNGSAIWTCWLRARSGWYAAAGVAATSLF